MDRRTFLKGLVATAAGVLIPGEVAAEPARRVWALDRTMGRMALVGEMGPELIRLGPGDYPLTNIHVFSAREGGPANYSFTLADGRHIHADMLSSASVEIEHRIPPLQAMRYEDLGRIMAPSFPSMTLTVRE